MALSLTTPRSALRTINDGNVQIKNNHPSKPGLSQPNSFMKNAFQLSKPGGFGAEFVKPGLKIHVCFCFFNYCYDILF